MRRGADAPQRAALTAAWAGLHARERRLIALAVGIVVAALLWWLALAPALGTLRRADAQRQTMQVQAQQMQRLAREAQTLKALPRITQDEALRALEAATRQRLGASAQLSVVGDRANLVLKDTPAEALAAWLADARANARAAPVEARLTRTGAAGAPARWSGTLSLGLPGQ